MGILSLLWGILAIVWMLFAFVPLLGWGNWFLLPFAGIGLLFSVLAWLLAGPTGKSRAKVGMLLNTIALLFGMLRLLLGGGVI